MDLLSLEPFEKTLQNHITPRDWRKCLLSYSRFIDLIKKNIRLIIQPLKDTYCTAALEQSIAQYRLSSCTKDTAGHSRKSAYKYRTNCVESPPAVSSQKHSLYYQLNRHVFFNVVYLYFVNTCYSRYREKKSVNSVVITRHLPRCSWMCHKEAPGSKHWNSS